MTVEVLTSVSAMEQIAHEWRQIETGGTVPVPFSSADWVLSWWKHLAAAQAAVHDRPWTLAVRDSGGALLAVAPLMITERPASGPLKARCLQFIGADPNVTEVRTLAVRSGHEEAVYGELLRFILSRHREWDWMRWTGIAAANAGPVESFGGRWVGQVSAWALALPASWEEFKSGLSRNSKEALRKCVNAPKRDGVELRTEVIQDPEGTGRELERFFELHAARASLTDTVEHPNVFRGEAERGFLREVCDRYARRGALQVFCIKVGGSTVAVRIGFRVGSWMYLYFSGYDPPYAKYSVMNTCTAEAIRWCIENGVASVNLSTGVDRAKTRWSPSELTFREALFVASPVRSRAAHAVYGWLTHAKVRGFLSLARRRGAP